MTAPIIEVKNLSKKYNINRNGGGYITLRDSLTYLLKNPFSFAKSKAKQVLKKGSTEEFWALKDINFTVNRGEAIGIIGANGAGKSTLLKILSEITPPTTGEINLRGRVASLLEVGTGFHPELTGRENIYLNGSMLGMTKIEIEKKFKDIVEFAGIDKFLDTPVKRYSSGMYVRLAFSVAAHLESDILIIDEVLAVGDAEFQKKCLGKMNDVMKDSRRTIIFVSHNMNAIRDLCKKVIVLNEGKIIEFDETEKAISTYVNDVDKNVLKKEWNDELSAPKNNTGIINSIKILNSKEEMVENLSIDDSFNIEVDYTIKEVGGYFGIIVTIYDINNNCIFSSINNKEENWYGKPMPLGKFKSVCHLPESMFNNGSFIVNVNFFGRNYSDIVSLKNVLKIDLTDGKKVRGDYSGGYGGVMRPQLLWETNKLT